MKHIKLGTLEVARIGLGAMGMSTAFTGAGSDDAESIRTIHRAIDLGVTLIDTAEIYGPFANEELVGRALKDRRDQVVLATKFGMFSHAGGGPGHLDSSPANIRTAIEGSLPTMSTFTTSTASIPKLRSRTRSAPFPNSWLKARSGTSACPRPGWTPSGGRTLSTRSAPYSRSTHFGLVTKKQTFFLCCVNSG